LENQKMTALETLMSACVAVIGAGNERGVRTTKRSWLLKRGTRYENHNFSMETFSDIWLAFGFQVNFMYDTVH
jgi:hypothetical protein